MRTQFNCCKTYNCSNLANPDLSLYQTSSQLGFASYKCPLCGAFTPILENEPILSLTRQIESNQLQLPNVECPTCLKQTYTHAYGYTRIGTPRLKCQQCSSVFSLLSPNKIARTLQPLLALLLSGALPCELLQKSQLNSKTFYVRIKQLSSLLRQLNQLYIQQYLGESEGCLSLHTASFTSLSRSGQGHSLKCWNLSTTECRYGFHVLDTDNLYLNRTQTETVGLYYLNTVEALPALSDSSFQMVQATYDKIFARTKFDELGYAIQAECQSNNGEILRPVYAAHAHWISLSKLLPKYHSFDFFLEHESFIRGGAITNLTPEVISGNYNLYYLYAQRSLAVTPSLIEHKSIGWWGETWSTQTRHYPSGYWDVTFCALTANKRPTLEFNGVEWHQDYLEQLHQWLPLEHQKTLSYEMTKHWRTIFTYLYNFTYNQQRSAFFGEFDFTSIAEIATALNQCAANSPHKK
ncbi:hypothetical protein BCT35_21310 [Vibrio lentus]|nr:hypothetical protein BCU45_02895 [Vibrio lentus]PMI63847.1 hypothetical protein BCU40_02475 [Vibrio lentus]PMJ50635.1 hypothetical protein BCU20_08475 [Vibrio lentus]PML47584.1 hypothetical protein BCT75_03660 [Vibrio lentus]PMN06882.1 hypothetical protein BCT42_00065 [Vibrio lentus]